MANNNIIKISRFCTDDGDGIRTVVFLKGCPLKCAWCHNPESQSLDKEITFDINKCVNCKACLGVCKNGCHTFDNGVHTFKRDKCTACGKCSKVCGANALELVGETLSAEEIVNEVEKDMVFYKTSNGGVTISGGEPLFQSQFTSEILRLCKEKGIHTAIETSGFASEKSLSEVLRYCDLVLFDIKETNEENHKKLTGVSLAPILKNLELVNKSGVPFIIRLPIIPSINDRKSHFENVKKIVKGMKGCRCIQIMPYHSLGAYKYSLLGIDYSCSEIPDPTTQTIEYWNSLLK